VIVILEDRRIIALVPSYNEAAHVGGVVSTMPAFVDVIVVVDDCSVDETSLAALKPGDLASLTAPSLFGGGLIVVVRDVQDAAKNVAGELVSAAADPAPDVVLVLTHAGGVKGKALLATLTGQGAPIIECPKITRLGDRMQFVRAEFRQAAAVLAPRAVRRR